MHFFFGRFSGLRVQAVVHGLNATSAKSGVTKLAPAILDMDLQIEANLWAY